VQTAQKTRRRCCKRSSSQQVRNYCAAATDLPGTIQEDLIGSALRQIKDGGVIGAVSSIPQRAAEFGKIAQDLGLMFSWLQSTVPPCDSISSEYKSLDLEKVLP